MSHLHICKDCGHVAADASWVATATRLESENARLREDFDTARKDVASLGFRLGVAERERDEARAALEAEKAENDRRDSLRIDEILGLREMHGATLLELDEARAACAAMREFLSGFVNPQHSVLAPTAGADLLARLEKAEWKERELQAFQMHLKGRANVLDNPPSTADLMNVLRDYDAQLEAMRAALEAVLQWHDTGQHPDATPWADVRAALSPSAPRAYRNAVLEEAAKHLDDRGVNEDSDYLHEASAIVRALKDGET